jgi:hypothetical protein
MRIQFLSPNLMKGREGAVGTATRLQVGHPRNHGLILGWDRRFDSSLQCPDQPWNIPNLLFHWYGGFFPRG